MEKAVFIYLQNDFRTLYFNEKSRDSSVGMATLYVLDGPEFELQWGKDILVLHPHLDWLWSLPSLHYNGHRPSFPGEKSARACT